MTGDKAIYPVKRRSPRGEAIPGYVISGAWILVGILLLEGFFLDVIAQQVPISPIGSYTIGIQSRNEHPAWGVATAPDRFILGLISLPPGGGSDIASAVIQFDIHSGDTVEVLLSPRPSGAGRRWLQCLRQDRAGTGMWSAIGEYDMGGGGRDSVFIGIPGTPITRIAARGEVSALDVNRAIAVAYWNLKQVELFTPRGHSLKRVSLPDHPSDIVYDGEGKIYVGTLGPGMRLLEVDTATAQVAILDFLPQSTRPFMDFRNHRLVFNTSTNALHPEEPSALLTQLWAVDSTGAAVHQWTTIEGFGGPDLNRLVRSGPAAILPDGNIAVSYGRTDFSKTPAVTAAGLRIYDRNGHPLFAWESSTAPPVHTLPFGLNVTPDGKQLILITKQSGVAGAQWSDVVVYLFDLGPAGVTPGGEAPRRFILKQNYPNPFNGSTRIEVEMPHTGRVSIKIYDLRGREVNTLFEGILPPGTHRWQWNGTNREGLPVATGVYLYRVMVQGGVRESRKMLLVR